MKKRKLSKETRAKISAARTGFKHSDKDRANMVAAQKLRLPETNAKISKTLTGRKLSPEHKAKISAGLKCRKLSPEHKAKISKALKGNRLSDESRVKLSESLKGRKLSDEHRAKLGLNCARGENHHNWRGGISFEPYCPIWACKEFKEYIKERDGYKCQNPDCWGTADHLPLAIMHIDNDKMNCHPDNLITGCISCNSRANKDRKWHTLWYKAIMYQQGKLLDKRT